MAEITSILDTDLYKLTMQQAVMRKFPTAVAKVRFTNRSEDMLFTKECIEIYKKAVAKLAGLQLTVEEREWLGQNCPYLESDYLDYTGEIAVGNFSPGKFPTRFVLAGWKF